MSTRIFLSLFQQLKMGTKNINVIVSYVDQLVPDVVWCVVELEIQTDCNEFHVLQ